MAWAERFTCDVCGKLRGETEAWWIAEINCATTNPSTIKDNPAPSLLKLMPWYNLTGHSADSRHLCGAGCVHTFLDRWMSDLHAGNEGCAENL